jgi:branched-chain amino acid transport system ATP-binding protein
VLNSRASLVIVALSLVALPFALDLAGLPLRSSIDVVAFAVACMGLNILVGNTNMAPGSGLAPTLQL